MDIILDNFLLLVVKNRILYDIMKKANTYLFIANTHGSETYIVELKDCTNEAEIINKISGRVLDEETVYKTLLVSEEGKDIGRSCIISIFDNLGDEIRTITISSEHWIGGAQYLGKIDGNDD